MPANSIFDFPSPHTAVLVVEEQAMRRDLLLLLLRRLRYGVVTAGSADEARKALRREAPDVILLGHRLPDGDGLRLAAEWRCAKAPVRAPIVLFGLNIASVDADLCRTLDVLPVPGQPMPIDRLLRTTRRVLLERTGAAMMDTPTEVIDLRHLDSFTEGDAAFERELADLFLGSAEACVQRMRAALTVASAASDWPAAAHALKGAAANLGARQVAARARDLEAAVPEAEGLALLGAEIEAVRAFFAGRPC
ncbi:Hpt domain-containing protein [Marinivivus vitaminiproducens]|uniref:Hpt domain-containing protein n=1 Tax=Marinivivus vitaminiproducens TaxID=3035935 RepID=UPI0027A3955C|nr:Hpt domain-containing protein [Geminicoccaceae bacterium SCSIO 64248]